MSQVRTDPYLTQGVMGKRCLAWLIDVGVILVIMLFLGVFLAVFGLLTFGLGWGMYALLPAVPFLYHFLTLANFGATPGQRFVGLTVRRFDDMGPPTWPQAFICTLCFYLTLGTSGVLLLVALVTEGHRTLHDLASGLVVVHSTAALGYGSGRSFP